MKQLGLSTPQDVFYYEPLHLWAKAMGLLPLFNINRLSDGRPAFWNGVILMGLFTAWYSFQTYGKINYLRDVHTSSIFVTDIGADFCIYLTNIVSIVWVCFIKSYPELGQFIKMLKDIDTDLRTIQTGIDYPRYKFLTEFVLTNIFFVIFYVLSNIFWESTLTWEIYRYYFLRDIQRFHVLILSLLMRNYALAIRNRICTLNDLLAQKRPSQELLFSANNTKAKMRMDYRHILLMRKIFANICRAVEMFNDIYGLMYLIIYVYIVVFIITAANFGLVYGVANQKLGNTQIGIIMMLFCAVWITIPLLIGFFVFASADNCHFEFKRTPWICYSVIDELTAIHPKSILITELEKFSQQVNNSHVEITAAGWFTVNYSIFFALIGSLSSYIIVLLQFM